MREIIKKIIEETLREAPCDVDIRYNEPMSAHTTFKVGGLADCFLRPKGENFEAFSAALLRAAKKMSVPVFILGGGANIVVSDNGISGFVLDTGAWKDCVRCEEGLIINSGATMNEAVEYAEELSLSGLEFLAGMPGSIGGALFMNARCYGSETADVLAWAEVIDFSGDMPAKQHIAADKADFGYKRSPFQGKDWLILRACFNLKSADKNEIKSKRIKNINDRKEKGHYSFPCAGSAFKNNRDFGKPTGQIIDELGLRGFSIGGAQVAPFHGNIIINTGNASAADIRALMNEVAARVKSVTGFVLEPEIIFTGNFSPNH